MIITAAEIFERENITSLPLNPGKLAKNNGVILLTYSALQRSCGIDPKSLSGDGFSFVADGSPRIAYNEQITSLPRQRWTLIHELCHLWLGHLNMAPNAIQAADTFERAADRLTSQLLCPISVLHLCSVSTAAQIAELCGVSLQAAEFSFRELTLQRREGKLLTPEEQQRLAVRFLPFISSTITAKVHREQDRARYKKVDIKQGEHR